MYRGQFTIASTPTEIRDNASDMTPGLRSRIEQADGVSDIKETIERLINQAPDVTNEVSEASILENKLKPDKM